MEKLACRANPWLSMASPAHCAGAGRGDGGGAAAAVPAGVPRRCCAAGPALGARPCGGARPVQQGGAPLPRLPLLHGVLPASLPPWTHSNGHKQSVAGLLCVRFGLSRGAGAGACGSGGPLGAIGAAGGRHCPRRRRQRPAATGDPAVPTGWRSAFQHTGLHERRHFGTEAHTG
jgi:hypothetical protein